jgi:Protein of unknown function (DUF3352)
MTEPVPTRPRAGPSRGRWVVVIGVAGLAIVGAVAAIAVLSGRPTPEALRYIPADEAMVAELRMDLPGDQLQKVGNLLAHFPGFKDQSILGQKIDETIDRLANAASSGSVSYTTQVKPWLAGPLFAGARAPGAGPGSTRWVVVATTNGQVSCDAPFAGQPSPTASGYNGVDLHVSADGSFACALDGRYGILGDPASVRAALDAHAGHSGIDTVSQYRSARDALGGDRLATVYVSRDALAGTAGGAGAIPSQSLVLPSSLLAMTPGFDAVLSSLPAWAMAGLSAEDDAIVLDLVTAPLPPAASSAAGSSSSPAPPPASGPPPHTSRVATLVPADTLLLLDVHGAGAALRNGIAALRANPQVGTQVGQVDAALGALGGPEALVNWVGDAGIVIVPDGTPATGAAPSAAGGAPVTGLPPVTGGILLLAADDATATARADQLRGLLVLAALGGSVTTHDRTIDGTRVTIADLGDLSKLSQAIGGGVTVPAGTHAVISIAARGPMVMIGSGESFARRILDTAPGSSLADLASYRTAMGHGVESNVGQAYLSVGGLIGLVEPMLPEADRARFDADDKPYLAPFDSLLVTDSLENGGVRVRLVVTVK